MLTFGSGVEGFMVWVTKNRLPLLGLTPGLRMASKKGSPFSVFLESDFGLKVFVRKEHMKSRMEDLDLTTIIFNVGKNAAVSYTHLTLPTILLV